MKKEKQTRLVMLILALVLILNLFSKNMANAQFGEGGFSTTWLSGSGKITTLGKVGIGTSNPGRKLEVFNSYDNFIRVASTGGNQYEDYQAGIELRRKTFNGNNLDWALVNDGTFKIKYEGQKIFHLSTTVARLGYNIDNPMEVIVNGKNVEENNFGSILGGGLRIQSKKSSILHTLRIDGNQLESNKELNINAFSEENIALVNGGGKVKVGTGNGEAKMNIAASEDMQLKLINPGSGGASWRLGVANSSWSAGAGKLVFTNTNSSSDATMVITPAGKVGIGMTTPSKTLDVNGTARAKIVEITGGSDFAESFEINEKVVPGSVVSIDTESAGRLKVANKAYDKRVAGIVSGAGNINPGMIMGQEGSIADGEYPVALTGRVYCLVDAAYGAVEPGDLLTTSNTVGHAMKVSEGEHAQGAIIGKAMTSLKEGKGLVLVLVSLQ